MAELAAAGIEVVIYVRPNEIADAIAFPDDTRHCAYDAAAVTAFWQALVRVDGVFRSFRTAFLGKASPVQLRSRRHPLLGPGRAAASRRRARPARRCAREAYSHQVSSAGFWPGNDTSPQAVFYSYAYPTPSGFAEARVGPDGATWSAAMGEWLLPYERVRGAADPAAELKRFLQLTYRAAADLAQWDGALECSIGTLRRPRVVSPPG